MHLQHIVGPVVLFLLMTTVGLELRLADFTRVLKAPKVIAGSSSH